MAISDATFVAVSVTGNKELDRALAQMSEQAERKAVRPAIKASCNRLKGEVAQRLSGHPVKPESGRLLAAMIAEKPIIDPSRGSVRYGLKLPTREELGIGPKDKHYYPIYLEYGTCRMPPHSFMRAAIDENREREMALIRRDIGQRIVRRDVFTAKRALGLTK